MKRIKRGLRRILSLDYGINFRLIRREITYIRGKKRKKETELFGMLIDETKGETVNPSYNFAKAATKKKVQKLGLGENWARSLMKLALSQP